MKQTENAQMWFEPTRACLTPQAAGVMYARQEPDRLEWSKDWHDVIVFEFRRLRDGNRQEDYAGWKHIHGRSNVWDNARRIVLEGGRWAFEGRCGDFCPELKRRLQGRRIPARALSLVLCLEAAGVPHMVLAVNTDRGHLICCNIQGCWDLGDPAFEDYRWDAMESADGTWLDLKPIEAGTLESLMG